MLQVLGWFVVTVLAVLAFGVWSKRRQYRQQQAVTAITVATHEGLNALALLESANARNDPEAKERALAQLNEAVEKMSRAGNEL